jgi:hypothetical protein
LGVEAPNGIITDVRQDGNVENNMPLPEERECSVANDRSCFSEKETIQPKYALDPPEQKAATSEEPFEETMLKWRVSATSDESVNHWDTFEDSAQRTRSSTFTSDIKGSFLSPRTASYVEEMRRSFVGTLSSREENDFSVQEEESVNSRAKSTEREVDYTAQSVHSKYASMIRKQALKRRKKRKTRVPDGTDTRSSEGATKSTSTKEDVSLMEAAVCTNKSRTSSFQDQALQRRKQRHAAAMREAKKMIPKQKSFDKSYEPSFDGDLLDLLATPTASLATAERSLHEAQNGSKLSSDKGSGHISNIFSNKSAQPAHKEGKQPVPNKVTKEGLSATRNQNVVKKHLVQRHGESQRKRFVTSSKNSRPSLQTAHNTPTMDKNTFEDMVAEQTRMSRKVEGRLHQIWNDDEVSLDASVKPLDDSFDDDLSGMVNWFSFKK